MIPLAGGVGPQGCLNLTDPDRHLATTSATTIASVFVLDPHWDSPIAAIFGVQLQFSKPGGNGAPKPTLAMRLLSRFQPSGMVKSVSALARADGMAQLRTLRRWPCRWKKSRKTAWLHSHAGSATASQRSAIGKALRSEAFRSVAMVIGDLRMTR